MITQRWLPDSGRYSLNAHLPVFLWKLSCQKRGVHEFWELMDLISLSDLRNIEEELETEETDESDKMDHFSEHSEDVNISAAVIPCLMCDFIFNEWESLEQHVAISHNYD